MATGPLRHVTRERQNRRRELDPYLRATGLVQLPFGQGINHNFGATGQTPVRLPGSIRLAVSFSVPLAQGVLTVEVAGGRNFTHPALAADEVYRGEFAEEGKEVTIARGAAPAGTATIYIVDDIGRNLAIGTAVFV